MEYDVNSALVRYFCSPDSFGDERADKVGGFLRCDCGKIHTRHLSDEAKCTCGRVIDAFKGVR